MFFTDETKHIVCGAQNVYWQLGQGIATKTVPEVYNKRNFD